MLKIKICSNFHETRKYVHGFHCLKATCLLRPCPHCRLHLFRFVKLIHMEIPTFSSDETTTILLTANPTLILKFVNSTQALHYRYAAYMLPMPHSFEIVFVYVLLMMLSAQHYLTLVYDVITAISRTHKHTQSLRLLPYPSILFKSK